MKQKTTCPACYNELEIAGTIKIRENHDYKFVNVYYCRLCGWRGTL